jgi:MFS family permease
MEENRKPLIISGIGLAFLMGMIALLILAANPWEEIQSLAIGAALGLGVGIALCWYILLVWDPATMQERGKQVNNTYSTGCWLPVIIIGGIVGGWLLSSYFAGNLLDMLVACFLSALTLMLFVSACLAWWYRPKKDS